MCSAPKSSGRVAAGLGVLSDGALVHSMTETVEVSKTKLDRLEKLAPLADLADELGGVGELMDAIRAGKEFLDFRPDAARDIAELKRAVSSDGSDGETADSATQSPETPLEDVVALPEYLAGDQLSANQERARFVARDVQDYCQKVRAGFVISATDLRRVLAAKEKETKIHRKTAHRVMDWLAKLGEANGIEVVKRRGTKRVVFPADQVDRLAELGRSANVSPSSRSEAPGGPR